MTKNVNKICDYSFHPLRVSRPYFKWNIFANEENIYVADGRNPIHFLPTLEKKSNTHSSYDFINNASFLSHQKRLISKKEKKKRGKRNSLLQMGNKKTENVSPFNLFPSEQKNQNSKEKLRFQFDENHPIRLSIVFY